MTISEQGLNLIKRYEGCVLKAYRCPAGVLTIGYGHTGGVREGQVITRKEADEYLKRDVKAVETCISTAVQSRLSQNQFDALCSFTFNVGCGNFLRSTLLKKIKVNPSDPAIRAEFAKWVHAKSVVLPGLVKRRKEEADLYFR